MGLLAKQAFGTPNAPTVREFKENDKTATRRWDPNARQWVDMATAPRFKPGERGELTLAQKRENAEIQQARKALDREGLSHQDVMRISKSQRDTGRDNPEYSPFINGRVRQATRRKYGDDPEYAATYGRYLTPGPEFSDPAGPKALPPGVSVEEPGLFQRGHDYLFGDDAAAAAGNPLIPRRRPVLPSVGNEGPATLRPRGPRGRFPARRTGNAASIPRMTVQEIDDLINQRGYTLSPTELRAVQTRLKALGL